MDDCCSTTGISGDENVFRLLGLDRGDNDRDADGANGTGTASNSGGKKLSGRSGTAAGSNQCRVHKIRGHRVRCPGRSWNLWDNSQSAMAKANSRHHPTQTSLILRVSVQVATLRWCHRSTTKLSPNLLSPGPVASVTSKIDSSQQHPNPPLTHILDPTTYERVDTQNQCCDNTGSKSPHVQCTAARADRVKFRCPRS
jgi:hypothetical protein